MNRYEKMADAAKASTTPEELEVIRADDVKMEALDWWWPNRFALGKLGLLGGNPERGKGLILSDVFSRLTRGGVWPCGEGSAEAGDCVLLQMEDDNSDTVVPRLVAAGADRSRIRLLNMVKKADSSASRVLNICNDLPMIEKVLDSLENPLLVAIDPLTAYIGKLNAASGNEVRSALAPLLDLLKRFHIGGLGVMHFNKKIDVENALARIADSVAFGAVARHCFVVTDDPENERRLLVKAKNNLAPDVKGLSYTIQEVHVGHDHRDGREIRQPRIIWGHEHVEISATQAMQAENGGGSAHNPRKEAKDFILRMVASGGTPAAEIEDAADGEGISLRTLKNAKRDLKIVSKKDGLSGGWRWYLPDDAPKEQPKADEF
jgi:putative DNA primase/helicase